MLKYEENKELLEATLAGFVASMKFEFPPRNPYATCGIRAGEGEGNPLRAAWFYGYWHFAYNRSKLNWQDCYKMIASLEKLKNQLDNHSTPS